MLGKLGAVDVKEVQEKWQKEVDGLDAKLGGTPERPIELTIVSLDTPDYMTSICSAGAYICACMRVVDQDRVGGKAHGRVGGERAL